VTYLPSPFEGAGDRRALARVRRAGVVDEAHALSQGHIASISENFSHRDTARRVDRGFDLFDKICDRTTQIHKKVQHAQDEDLRDWFMMGLQATFEGAVIRTRRYVDGGQ
jgi:hypothetical protein